MTFDRNLPQIDEDKLPTIDRMIMCLALMRAAENKFKEGNNETS